MTSLFIDDWPMLASCSSTRTSRPRAASARAIESPITPVPTTTASVLEIEPWCDFTW